MGFSLSSGLAGKTGAFDEPDKLKRFSTLTPDQQAISSRLSGYFGSRIGQGMPMYGGQRVAGMSPSEQQGMGQLRGYLSGMGTYMPQRQAAYGRALGGQMLPPIDMGASREWFEQQVVPQYQQRFQQFAAPALEQAKSMGARAGSSAMDQALAAQAGKMGMYLGDVGYQHMQAEEQAMRERQLLNAQMQQGAMGMGEPMRGEQLSMVQASQQYGALPRLLQQAQLDASFQDWLRARPEYAPVIQQALAFLGISMQGTYFEPQPGLLGEMAQAAGQVGQIASVGAGVGGMGGGMGGGV